jgi:hypothetical protein
MKLYLINDILQDYIIISNYNYKVSIHYFFKLKQSLNIFILICLTIENKEGTLNSWRAHFHKQQIYLSNNLKWRGCTHSWRVTSEKQRTHSPRGRTVFTQCALHKNTWLRKNFIKLIREKTSPLIMQGDFLQR